MTDGTPPRRRARRPSIAAPALHEVLVPLVVLVGGLGIAFPGAARTLRPEVPAMLAGQVLGVAMTIPFNELAPVLRRPKVLVGALAVQWTTQPLLGLGLLHLAGGNHVGQGTFITAAAPAEITSALVAVVAGGAAATAATLMTMSVAVGCVLTPLWLLLLQHGHVEPAVLVPELALSVALPLAVGVALRSRAPVLASHSRRCLDLAGLSLLLVLFVGAGYARPLFETAQLGEAVLLALVLGAVGAATAWAFTARARGPMSRRVSLAFPIGMREFGIATAVALIVAPRSAGFGGLYGVIMMTLAAATATALRRRLGRPAPQGDQPEGLAR